VRRPDKYAAFILAYTVLRVLDAATTCYAVSRFGLGVETNPFVANLIELYGLLPTAVIMVLLPLPAVIGLARALRLVERRYPASKAIKAATTFVMLWMLGIALAPVISNTAQLIYATGLLSG